MKNHATPFSTASHVKGELGAGTQTLSGWVRTEGAKGQPASWYPGRHRGGSLYQPRLHPLLCLRAYVVPGRKLSDEPHLSLISLAWGMIIPSWADRAQGSHAI